MEYGRSRDWGEVVRREKPDSDSHGHVTAGLAHRHQNHWYFNLSDFFLFILIALAMLFATLRGHERSQDAAMSTARIHMWHGLRSYLLLSRPANSSPQILKIGQRWDNEGS